MSGAFPHKRVVHAGLNGNVVSPKETCRLDSKLATGTPGRNAMRLHSHLRFVRQMHYCGFFQKTVRVKVLKTNIDGLVSELKLASELPRLKDGRSYASIYRRWHTNILSLTNSERLLKATAYGHRQTIMSYS